MNPYDAPREKGRDRVRMGEKTAQPPVSMKMTKQDRDSQASRLATVYGVNVENVTSRLLPLGQVKPIYSDQLQKISSEMAVPELIPTHLTLRYTIVTDRVKDSKRYFDINVEVEEKDKMALTEAAEMAYQDWWKSGFIGPPPIGPLYDSAREHLLKLTHKTSNAQPPPAAPVPVFCITSGPAQSKSPNPAVHIIDTAITNSPMKRARSRRIETPNP